MAKRSIGHIVDHLKNIRFGTLISDIALILWQRKLQRIMSKKIQVSITRVEETFIIFPEKPSDRYGFVDTENKLVESARIDPCELFSRFTADIIKKEIIFTR